MVSDENKDIDVDEKKGIKKCNLDLRERNWNYFDKGINEQLKLY